MQARIAVPAHIYLRFPCSENESTASIQTRAAQFFESLSDVDYFITIDLGEEETDATVFADYNAENGFEIDPSKITVDEIEPD